MFHPGMENVVRSSGSCMDSLPEGQLPTVVCYAILGVCVCVCVCVHAHVCVFTRVCV